MRRGGGQLTSTDSSDSSDEGEVDEHIVPCRSVYHGWKTKKANCFQLKVRVDREMGGSLRCFRWYYCKGAATRGNARAQRLRRPDSPDVHWTVMCAGVVLL